MFMETILIDNERMFPIQYYLSAVDLRKGKITVTKTYFFEVIIMKI